MMPTDGARNTKKHESQREQSGVILVLIFMVYFVVSKIIPNFKLQINVMKITRIWFDADYIYGVDESGREYRQSLLWYPALMSATDEDRANYKFGFRGIHWRALDEDVSFDSFAAEDAEPSALQRFFLIHKEIKISEFAKMIGIDATLLRNYINGFKKPSKEREQVILGGIHALAGQYAAAAF